MITADARRILETALICSQQPLAVRELRVLFNDELGADTIKELIPARAVALSLISTHPTSSDSFNAAATSTTPELLPPSGGSS